MAAHAFRLTQRTPWRRSLGVDENAETAAYGSMRGHTDDMHHSHELVTYQLFCLHSSLWSYGKFLFTRDWSTMFVFPGYAMDQSRIDMVEVDTKLRDGNFDRVTDTQHVEGDGEGSMHADLTFIFGTLRFKRTHTHPTTHLARSLVLTLVRGRVEKASSHRRMLLQYCWWTEHRCPPLKFPATKSTCCWCTASRTPSSKFFTTPRFFFAYVLLMWNEIMVKQDLPFSQYPPERSTRSGGLWYPSWLSFSHSMLLYISGIVERHKEVNLMSGWQVSLFNKTAQPPLWVT